MEVARTHDANTASAPAPTANYQLHMHAGVSTSSAPRQHGPGAVVGACLVCRKLLVETSMETSPRGYTACSYNCERPLVIHIDCADATMDAHRVTELRQNCHRCRKTLSVHRGPKFSLSTLAMSARHMLNPLWVMRIVLTLVWYAILLVTLAIALAYAWKAFVWTVTGFTIAWDYAANPDFFDNIRPHHPAFGRFVFKHVINDNYTIVSSGWLPDWGHMIYGSVAVLNAIVIYYILRVVWLLCRRLFNLVCG